MKRRRGIRRRECTRCGKVVTNGYIGMDDLFEPRCVCRTDSDFRMTVRDWQSGLRETSAVVVTAERLA